MSVGAAARVERPSRAGAIARLPWWLSFLALAVVILALEWLWQGKTYWLYSDGVYLATARAVAGDAVLYRDLAAAQPPPIFYLGAGLLQVSDSVLWVRAALSVVTLVTASLVAVAVLRITGRRAAAAAAGLASLVLPWTLREHVSLTPEPLAAPFLLGAALLAARTRLAALAGALAVLATALKLAFLLPAAAVGLAAAGRTRYFVTAIALGLATAALWLSVWGRPLIDNLVVAQRQTGFQIGILPGHFAQAIWNLGPLVLLAALAVRCRGRARDPALMRTLLALAAGALLLVVTFVKQGTYLNLLALIEPLLVPLAAAGVVWLIEDRDRLPRLVPLAAWASVALIALQSIGLLVAPGNPLVFGNPFLDAPGRVLSSEGVELAARRARACPPGVPFSGEPYFAFVADRPLPAGQPDLFIIREAEVHADLREAVRRAQPRCPNAPKGG